jgi:alkylation response protein AidB-like acyl-CoA dehydrogenase
VSATLPSLRYSEVEDDLRDTVAAVLRRTCDWQTILKLADSPGPASPAAWSALRDIGVPGLPFRESRGGAGATWSEASVVQEELGWWVASVPFLTSAVLAGAVLDFIGPPGAAPLAALAQGQQTGALVVPWGAPLAPSTLACADGVVNGSVRLVAGAAEADILLVTTPDGLVLVEAADARVQLQLSLDMTRPLADVTFSDAPSVPLAGPELTAQALARASLVATAMLAAEQLGLASRCLDMTLDYVKQRRQFGRVIGSYQAVKHRLADLWTDLARCRATARYAAVCAALNSDDLPVAAALAKVVCSQVSLRAAEECVQLHGGIGFTWEHPAHLYLKRARADALALGAPAWHENRLGRLVNLFPP